MISTALYQLPLIKTRTQTDKWLLKQWSSKTRLEEDFVKFFPSKHTKLITLFMERQLLYVPTELLWELHRNRQNTLSECLLPTTSHSELFEQDISYLTARVQAPLFLPRQLYCASKGACQDSQDPKTFSETRNPFSE